MVQASHGGHGVPLGHDQSMSREGAACALCKTRATNVVALTLACLCFRGVHFGCRWLDGLHALPAAVPNGFVAAHAHAHHGRVCVELDLELGVKRTLASCGDQCV